MLVDDQLAKAVLRPSVSVLRTAVSLCPRRGRLGHSSLKLAQRHSLLELVRVALAAAEGALISARI